MRLQLRPLLRGAGAGVLFATTLGATLLRATPAGATQDAAARVTIFKEPSRDNIGITVTHPQLDVGTTIGPEVHLAVGYEVDIVSGATPKIFQPRPGTFGVDAVSSATKFSDVRHQFAGALSYNRPTSSVSLGGSYGFESDYKSLAITGATRSELLDHNFTVGLSYTHNFDQVCDANNAPLGDQPLKLKPLTSSGRCFTSDAEVATHHVQIDTFQPSVSWTATPKLLLQVGSTIQILDGFQSNPYRSVALGAEGNVPQERLPQFRQRYSVYARALYALPAVHGSAHLNVRGYQDSWAVQAVTGEVLLNKYFGNSFLLTLRGRYHLQTGASFYKDAVGYRNTGPNGQYWTGDRELSPMSNYLTGGKIALLKRPEQERSGWYVDMELALKYELLIYHLESADAPNADRKNAHILQAAFSLRF
jgi:Protein of unknown function (DUF3570)